MPGWLVTGGSGFLGRHLLNAVEREDVKAIAVGRSVPEGWPASRFARADLEDWPTLARTIAEIAPEVVIHAAGKTPPGDPGELARANTLATLNLLEACALLVKPTRVVHVGSAAELGPVAVDDLPVGETYSCRPLDAYARSKWMGTVAMLAARPPLEVVVARVFNPIGPGMPRSQAFGRFAATLAEAQRGPIHLVAGNLDARRDFLDARDVASALIALAHRGHAGEVYHVGTGESRRVGDGLEILIGLSGRVVEIETPPGPTSRGPADSRADIRKVIAHTGWRPRIAWETSLGDLWDEASRRRSRFAP